jgi:hypothetical protein
MNIAQQSFLSHQREFELKIGFSEVCKGVSLIMPWMHCFDFILLVCAGGDSYVASVPAAHMIGMQFSDL